ncbi:MAG: isocitrate lyase/phosphoenolpyruvate mutase family protein, partial [Halioglobus sp.]|nr:isocitrate lyase/phosphoenolpyruvate mutase family protein [Halioglobus sp.]
PKRCGHMAGKTVIPAAEMVGKIRAALDARLDDSTLLIARTDALGVNGFEDALERAERYLEAGADALFIEAPQSVAQMQQIGRQFGGRTPLVHNLVEGGNSPVTGSAGLQQLGYRLALYPAALLHQFVPAAQALLQVIANTGSTASLRSQLYELGDMNRVLGAEQLLAAAGQYAGDD